VGPQSNHEAPPPSVSSDPQPAETWTLDPHDHESPRRAIFTCSAAGRINAPVGAEGPAGPACDASADPDQPRPEGAPAAGSSSDEARLVQIVQRPRGPNVYYYQFPERPARVKVEHDPEKRVIRVIGPEGPPAVFRDQPVRFLVVEPNPQTGEISWVPNRCGEPKHLYLCREEPERR
jgi:hypothetical protein